MKTWMSAFAFAVLCAAAAVAASNDRKEQSADLIGQARSETRAAARAAAGVSAADVGDADSFGRNVHYIGVAQSGTVSFQTDCTPDPSSPPGPDDRCVVVVDPTVTTTFTARDIGRINLPAKASNSLLCHSVTSLPFWQFNNSSGVQQNGVFRYTVGFTIDNAVLNDPALTDPTTGLPLAGHLEVNLGNIVDAQTLEAGATAFRRPVTTRFCIGGIVSRQGLIGTYGLSAAQADQFFKTPMTIHLNMTLGSRWVDDAAVTYGLRLFGD
jgi:hypothetical protein